MVPPTLLTRPAVLPFTTAAVAPTTGDAQLKLPPGAVQATVLKSAPKPYSSTMVLALVLPPLRHCSPSKLRVKGVRALALELVKATAIQPAIAPLAGLPK